MASSAQGIDVSAYQSRLTTAELKGFAFAFTKATDGTRVDPNFKANWDVIHSAGIHRGAYHELQSGNGVQQADAFLAAVRPADGDMLAVVASDYPGVTAADVKAWLDHVHQSTSGHCPVLVYTDLSVGKTLGSCTGYPLWVAWPSPVAPSAAQIAPFRSWKLWQWGTRSVAGGLGVVDADAYNGDATSLTAWINSFKPTAPPPPTGGRYVADGSQSMADAATAHHTTIDQILWHTADHHPHGYGSLEVQYINGGNLAAPMPAGMVYWTA